MSACPQCGDRLIEQIYGELGRDDVGLLEAHLDRSPECRRELESLRATLSVVGEAPEHAGPSTALLDALRAEARRGSAPAVSSSAAAPAPRLVTTAPPRSPRTFVPIWAMAAAATIVAIVAIGMFSRSAPNSQVAELPAPGLVRDSPSPRADAVPVDVSAGEAESKSSEGTTAASSDALGELESEASSQLADFDVTRPSAPSVRPRPQPKWDGGQPPADGMARAAKASGQAPPAAATVPSGAPSLPSIVAAIQHGDLAVALSTYDSWQRESGRSADRRERFSGVGAEDDAVVAGENAGTRSRWTGPATAGAALEQAPARGAVEQRRVADDSHAQQDPFATILRALLASSSRTADEQLQLDGSMDSGAARLRIELFQRLVDDAPPATAVEAARAAVELSVRIGDPTVARRARSYLDATQRAPSRTTTP